MSGYMQEKRAFDCLKSSCPETVKGQYEVGINALLQYYNTTIYENRFIVGGAVEVFTYAIMRATGISCALYADQSKSGEL